MNSVEDAYHSEDSDMEEEGFEDISCKKPKPNSTDSILFNSNAISTTTSVCNINSTCPIPSLVLLDDKRSKSLKSVMKLSDSLQAYCLQYLSLSEILLTVQTISKHFSQLIWKEKFLWSRILVSLRFRKRHIVQIEEVHKSMLQFLYKVGPYIRRIAFSDWMEVEDVVVNNTCIVEKLLSCTQVEELELVTHSLTNPLMYSIFKKCKQLKKLHIHRTNEKVTRDVMISSLNNSSFAFEYCDEEHLQCWQQIEKNCDILPNLEEFHFIERNEIMEAKQFSSNLLKWFPRAAPNLKKLNLNICIELLCEDVVLRSIAHHCQQLQAISLTFFGPYASMKVIETGIKEILIHCELLREFSFFSDLVTVPILKNIIEYGKHIQNLNLFPTNIARDSLSTLSCGNTWNRVKQLELHLNSFSAELLDFVLDKILSDDLERLTLHYVTELYAPIVAKYVRRCSNLTRMELKQCTDMDGILSSVGECCHRLKKLVISGMFEVLNVASRTFNQLMKNCTELTHMDLPQELVFTVPMLESILQHQPRNLKKLKIWGYFSEEFSQFDMKECGVNPLNSLQTLKLNSTTTDTEILVFCKSFPSIQNLQILDFDFDNEGKSRATAESLHYITTHCQKLHKFHFDFIEKEDAQIKIGLNKNRLKKPCHIGGIQSFDIYMYFALQLAFPDYVKNSNELMCLGQVQYFDMLESLKEIIPNKTDYDEAQKILNVLLTISVLDDYIAGLSYESKIALKEEALLQIKDEQILDIVSETMNNVLEIDCE